MKLIKQTTLALTACLFIASQAMAGEVTLPNTFSANTPAVADEVNANFTAVKTAVDNNNARLNVLEAATFDYKRDISIIANNLAVRHDSPEYSKITSVTVTAPADGFVMVTASGRGCIHTANKYVQLLLSSSPTAYSSLSSNYLAISGASTDQSCGVGQSVSFSFTHTEPVSEGSVNTYYFIGNKGDSDSISGILHLSGFTAQFIHN